MKVFYLLENSFFLFFFFVIIPPKWVWELGKCCWTQKDCECNIRELWGYHVASRPLGTEQWFWADDINACVANTEVGVKACSTGLQFCWPLRVLPTTRYFAANSQKWIHKELSFFLRLQCCASLLRGPSPGAWCTSSKIPTTLPLSHPCQDRLV